MASSKRPLAAASSASLPKSPALVCQNGDVSREIKVKGAFLLLTYLLERGRCGGHAAAWGRMNALFCKWIDVLRCQVVRSVVGPAADEASRQTCSLLSTRKFYYYAPLPLPPLLVVSSLGCWVVLASPCCFWSFSPPLGNLLRIFP